jgi:plasmid stabilization system protein ParE
VFYVVEEADIFVVRILHDAMDAPRHFAPEEGQGR